MFPDVAEEKFKKRAAKQIVKQQQQKNKAEVVYDCVTLCLSVLSLIYSSVLSILCSLLSPFFCFLRSYSFISI